MGERKERWKKEEEGEGKNIIYNIIQMRSTTQYGTTLTSW